MIGNFVWSGLRKKIRDLGWWFFFFFFFSYYGLMVVVVVVSVVVANGGGGCGWLLKFAVDVFIIILMSYLYYFNQIVKNIDLLMLSVKR